MDGSIDVRIASLAAEQHGVLHSKQLSGIGLSSASVAYRVRTGRLHRVRHGVYAVGHPSLSRFGMFSAAVLGVRGLAAISAASALELWGIRPARSAIVDVITPVRTRHTEGIRYHQTRRLPIDELAMVERLPVTTVARTLVDLGMVLRPLQLVRVMDEAAFRGLLNVRAVREVMRRHRTSNGYPIIAEALDLHLGGSAGFKSGSEELAYELLQAARLERPKVNGTVEACGERIEVDLLWPEQRLCVEIDGHGHDRARTRREDAARDVLLRAAGYRVLRVRASDLRHDPEQFVRAVASELTTCVDANPDRV